MSGYRCVNFTDLCRLCSSAGSNNIQIFNDEILQKKITECLSINLNEKDKLPKVICASCLDYVQVFSDFRQSCSNAQKMLESCLNTSKLRNGGQVYIKDEVPTKKVLKPIQSPSTKLLPNLCNIVTTPQAKKNVLTSPNQPDFLSSIMQAVGIQTNDEASDNNISFTQNLQSSQSLQQVPQYTLTLDGGTLKSGQIQYKIENAGNINMTSQTQQILSKNVQDSQNQPTNTMSMDEFIKLKKNSAVLKSSPVAKEEPKNKKPKFNLILQASPQKQKFNSQVNVSQPQKTFGNQTTPSKSQIQIHNIEKILPANNQVSPSKQLVLPIMVRNDGTRNPDAAQLISQALTMSNNQSNIENKGQANPPFAYVQMKIQPNADGQLTLTPASTVPAPQQLQLSLSPQQLQQLSFQAPPQHQAPALTMQPQITVTQMPVQEQTDSQTQTPSITNLKTEVEVEEESFEHHDEDYFFMENDNDDSASESQAKDSPEVKPTITIIKKKLKPAKKVKDEDLTDLQSVQQEHSDMANKQLKQLTSFNTKRSESESAEKPPDLNLTICDVCKKVFKRKEFLMQHLKSHIGLRPFKCSEPTCNKSFSRKEHLLRHVVSHTGKKMFSCDVCKKLFSRKDNLNKHRRIHPDPSQTNGKHSCQTCSKSFAQRSQLAKHQSNCGGKSDESTAADENIREDEKDKETTLKKVKQKMPKKASEPVAKPPEQQQQSAPVVQQQQQQQIVTILQQQPQQQMKGKNEPQQQQQIILSMSQAQAMFQAQQQKNAVYTFPTNLILSNGSFMTNAGEVVSNFKFDNQ